MDLAAARAQIPVTHKSAYLNTGYSGPCPRTVTDSITRIIEVQSAEGPASQYVLDLGRAARTEARTSFARVLRASPEETVLTDNTTRGINIVLSGLTWRPGDEVVTSASEHFGALIPLYELRRRKKVNIRFVPLGPEMVEEELLDRLEAAISPQTRLLVLSHVMYTTGLRLPLPAVQKLARGRGVRVLWDAAQCAGQLALDVHGWGCDYYAVPGHKWLLGPGGTGALFVRKDLIPGLQPRHISGASTWTFDNRGRYEPPDGVPEKFEVSTGSAPLLSGVSAAAEFVLSIGVEEIERRWSELTERLRSGLRQAPRVRLVSPEHGATACGLVAFSLEGWEPQAVVEELWKRERIVVRAVVEPPAVRVSVDFFNTEDEIDRLVGVVRDLAR